jgi:DNA-binding NtrC family response regulator
MDARMPVVHASKAARQTTAHPKGEYLLFHCLVVTADGARRQFMERAAGEQGWEVVACGDAESAVDYLRRRFAQLAIIDLPSDESGELTDLLDRLPAFGDLLTIVCGHENDMEEEIWVRQTGAWLYLPGVDDATDMGLLCGEAKRIVERKLDAQRASATNAAPLRRAN